VRVLTRPALPLVPPQEFNKFDLYSKSDDVPDPVALRPYYEGLLKKYKIDGKLKW